ncbi:uncharacterized protein LOC110466726 [Mizuhopecten yessoensis]|uniref:DUF7042 domain-containing protein n=1 Tax=Mizuhopecten yessoensis TaxID=6573 RepID=A0A210PNG5_MIZYE|nr:uncharacterized protein LOC110466726 [Mizuhopecten yessoensis]OWF38049.1 hypothetical protein KP79_PYT12803 [Mizuhopecten yessoensis]
MTIGRWIILLVYGKYVLHSDAVCTYPTDLRGDWYSSSNGILTFENSAIQGFISGATLIGTQNYTCEFDGTGDRYIAKATVQFFTTVSGDVYLCMNMVKESDSKYIVTYESEIDSTTNQREVVILSGTGNVATESTICNIVGSYPTGAHEIFVNKDSVEDAAVTCPAILQNTLDVVVSNKSCTRSQLDGQTDTTRLSFTYSDCAQETLFSSNGQFICLYSFTDGSFTYLNVLNNDSSIYEPTTYRFSCFVLEAQGRLVYVTQHPEVCQSGQTPYNVSSSGRILVLIDNDPDTDMSGQIAVGVIIGLVVISVLGFGVLSFIRWFIYGSRKRIEPVPDAESMKETARYYWKFLKKRLTEKAEPFDDILKIINFRKRRLQRKALLSKRDSFIMELEVHEETNEESEFSDIELTVPKSAIRRLPSMDRKKMVQWIDCSKSSVSYFRAKPIWQKDWESYRDPFNMQNINRADTPSTSAQSVRTVSALMDTGDISWYEPEKIEKGLLNTMWKRIFKLLPQLAKKKEPDYFGS